jgi:hypothetical protein
MVRFRDCLAIFLIAMVGILLSGCGGEGGGSEVSQSSGTISGTITALEWDTPAVAADGTPMDPKRDLDYYEFYLRTDKNFGDDDLPVAHVASFTDVLSPNGKSFKRELTNEFHMDNLLPFTEEGKQHYISIRAVGVDGLKSGFMVPVAWDLS